MAHIEIVDVGPRDGLQNEAAFLPIEDKIDLVERLVDAGVRRLEVTSFVQPDRVPQMADAEEVCSRVAGRLDARLVGVVLNRRGLWRSLDCELDEINFVVVATDEFSRRNQGLSTSEMLAEVRELAPIARAAGRRVSVTVAAAFGCPFSGEVGLDRLLEIAGATAAAGIDELALADTIGVAVPTEIVERVDGVRAVAGDLPLRLHLHNTRNTGYANAIAGLGAGVAALDASVGGFGGCPFAPEATGNIATEDLAWMLERMGVSTGVDPSALADCGTWLGERLGKRPPALHGRAGAFPTGLSRATAPTAPPWQALAVPYRGRTQEHPGFAPEASHLRCVATTEEAEQ